MIVIIKLSKKLDFLEIETIIFRSYEGIELKKYRLKIYRLIVFENYSLI